MNRRLLARTLWLSAITILMTTIIVESRDRAATMLRDTGMFAVSQRESTISVDDLRRALVVIEHRNPFLLANRGEPASSSMSDASGQPRPASRARQVLVLQGTVGAIASGWEAVVSGVPGRDGSVVVRVGDTLAGVRVRRILRDTVVLGDADSTWRLTMRTSWR